MARRLFPGREAQGAVRIAANPDALVKLIEEGRIHFYMESLYATYLVNERTGARLLLRRWKKGRSEYRSVIFARRDSGLRDLDDLRGKLVVFEDPGSTSGYALPRSLLLGKGFVLNEKPSFGAAVAAGEIGYLFAHGDEENVINWGCSSAVRRRAPWPTPTWTRSTRGVARRSWCWRRPRRSRGTSSR